LTQDCHGAKKGGAKKGDILLYAVGSVD
jgi:hypothetical protein